MLIFLRGRGGRVRSASSRGFFASAAQAHQRADRGADGMKQENAEEPIVEVVRLAPQARVQRVGEHIVDAGETDRMDALLKIGDAGEADRMDALLETGTKTCEASTNSARETPLRILVAVLCDVTPNHISLHCISTSPVAASNPSMTSVNDSTKRRNK